jgi:hypothetical protein
VEVTVAQRFDVQGIDMEAGKGRTTDEQLKTFRAEIEAKGWKFIAVVEGGDEGGHTIFEISQSSLYKEIEAAFSDNVSVIGVPSDYPRN